MTVTIIQHRPYGNEIRISDAFAVRYDSDNGMLYVDRESGCTQTTRILNVKSFKVEAI